MVHDARVIPIIDSKARALARLDNRRPNRWLGNSVAWWEDDTLVVETRDVNPLQGERGAVPLSGQGRIGERLSRYSERQIHYEFEVDDPVYYSRPWRGEMSFNTTDQRLFEYACHEGNVGIRGILQGERQKEARRE